MMNPEIRDQWADALESGEYAQCRGTLTKVTPDGSKSHCCLGVLTELAVKAGVTAERTTTADTTSLFDRIGYGVADAVPAYALPPLEVETWAGLDNGNPMVDYFGSPYRLAKLNDSVGLDFPEIARLVREQL